MNTSRSVSRVQGIWLITLAAIILLGLHLRLETAQYTKVHHPIRADAANYTAYAYNLDRHGVYSRDISTAFSDATVPTPDAYRNPGYPLYLSFLISKKLEIFIKRTVYSQALISTLTLILIALLAHAVVGKLASVVVVLLAAISPHLILANTYILTETIYIFFLCLTLLATAKAMITEKQTFWAIAAVLLAATTLIRPTTQYFIVILVLFAWFSSDKRNRTKFSVIVFILFTLIMSTWVIRNFQAIGQPSDPSLMIKVLQHGM
jgi:hypothetical protein